MKNTKNIEFEVEDWEEIEPIDYIYVIISYRWGTGHSYTVGAFDNKEKAIKCADSHTKYRGGKYSCSVEKCTLNDSNNESDYAIEIYKTKCYGM